MTRRHGDDDCRVESYFITHPLKLHAPSSPRKVGSAANQVYRAFSALELPGILKVELAGGDLMRTHFGRSWRATCWQTRPERLDRYKKGTKKGSVVER